MYEQHFGLKQPPFGMTPDYGFLLQTVAHREALAGLTYMIMTRKGFCVLLGEAGTGKTTILSKVLGTVPAAKIQFSLIINPVLTPQEFLEAVLLDFGLRDIPASKPQRLLMLQDFIMQERVKGKVCLLAVDEAHKLTPELLEEIRLLTNLETSQEKLLQIILVGQPELADVLNRVEMRQLKQRIAVRLELKPLAPDQVGQYISHRWKCAGGNLPVPFSPDAIKLVAEVSQGIPRMINAACDNALLVTYGLGQTEVDRDCVAQVVQTLGWHTAKRTKPATAAGTTAPAATTAKAVTAPANTAAVAPVQAPLVPAPMPQEPMLNIFRHTPAPAKPQSIVARWAMKFRMSHEGNTI